MSLIQLLALVVIGCFLLSIVSNGLFRTLIGQVSKRQQKGSVPDNAVPENSSRGTSIVATLNRPFWKVLVCIAAFVLLYPVYDKNFNQGKSTSDRYMERIGMDVKERDQLLDEIGYTGWEFNSRLKQGCGLESRFCALVVDGKGWYGRTLAKRDDGTEMVTCFKPGLTEDKGRNPLMVRTVASDGRTSEPMHYKDVPIGARGHDVQFIAPKAGVMRSRVAEYLDSSSDDTVNPRLVVYTIRVPKQVLQGFVEANYASRPDEQPTLCYNRHIKAVWAKTFM